MKYLLVCILLGCWVFSTEAFGSQLIAFLLNRAGVPLSAAALQESLQGDDPPIAIVVLAQGIAVDSREQPYKAHPSAGTLERLVFGAWVARVTRLPILVSGGATWGTPPVTEASVMKRFLEESEDLRVHWVEDRSKNTYQNAIFSAEMLGKGKKVLLVTHAHHMLRARTAFEIAGLRPIPMPCGFQNASGVSVSSFRPSVRGIVLSMRAMHELSGILWWYSSYLWKQKGR